MKTAVLLGVIVVSALSMNQREQAGISGRILDRLWCPLIATVTLRHSRQPLDGPLQQVQSNMDGRFTFADVPAGRYWLDYALKPGGTGGDGVVVTDAGTYKDIHWPLPLGHRKLEITQRYLNITDVGVVRSMRELWARRRAAAGAHG